MFHRYTDKKFSRRFGREDRKQQKHEQMVRDKFTAARNFDEKKEIIEKAVELAILYFSPEMKAYRIAIEGLVDKMHKNQKKLDQRRKMQ